MSDLVGNPEGKSPHDGAHMFIMQRDDIPALDEYIFIYSNMTEIGCHIYIRNQIFSSFDEFPHINLISNQTRPVRRSIDSVAN